MPSYTEKDTRNTGVVDFAVVDEAVRYAPTRGTDSNGTTYFFGKQYWQSAKEAAWGSEDERDKNDYVGHSVFAVKDGADFYMILPKAHLFGIFNGAHFMPMNNWVLCRPYGTLMAFNGIVEPVGKEYEDNFAVITAVPEIGELRVLDVIQTLKHCDLPLEEVLNEPILAGYFIIERENIISKLMNTKYHAARGRLIVKPIDPEKEESTGFINLDADTHKLNLAQVVSAYEGSQYAGTTIVYGKNSGIALPSMPEQEGLFVIAEQDVFAIYKNQA